MPVPKFDALRWPLLAILSMPITPQAASMLPDLGMQAFCRPITMSRANFAMMGAREVCSEAVPLNLPSAKHSRAWAYPLGHSHLL
eukprot:1658843-Pyramimonas_sp.AAC.1